MELIDLGFKPYLLYAGIGLVLTVVICFSSPGGVWASIRKPAAAIGLLLVWGLVLAPMIAMQRRSIEADDGILRIRSTFYTSETRLSDIQAIYEYAPGDGIRFGTRTNGIGVPGLSSGWFRSKGNRYFVDAVDGANLAIYLSKSRYIIALQVKDPLGTREWLLNLAAAGEKAQAGPAPEQLPAAAEEVLDDLQQAVDEGAVGVVEEPAGQEGTAAAQGAEGAQRDKAAPAETRNGSVLQDEAGATPAREVGEQPAGE